MGEIILRNYPFDNYKILFKPKTGLFIRIEDNGFPEPFWAPSGPELLDISITNWCSRSCSFCYKNSDKNGMHMAFEDYERIMVEAKANNVFQVALGGGNPNQHPQFCEILEVTRKYGIVPSYTTNGDGLNKKILEATSKYCGAVAVSAYEPYSNMNKILTKFFSFNVKTNIHFLLDCNTIEVALQWMKKPPNFLKNINAIIFLNYKPVGKNRTENFLLKNNTSFRELFQLVTSESYDFKIGFDSCSVSGLVSSQNGIDFNFIEPCDGARFSAYISENLLVYPCSFLGESHKGESLRNKSLREIWNKSSLFLEARNRLNSNKCNACSFQEKCFNGCPFFPEINLCNNTFLETKSIV